MRALWRDNRDDTIYSLHTDILGSLIYMTHIHCELRPRHTSGTHICTWKCPYLLLISPAGVPLDVERHLYCKVMNQTGLHQILLGKLFVHETAMRPSL